MKESRQSQSLNGLNGSQTGNLICVWTLFSITSTLMVLRIVAQTRILRRIGVDDIVMIIAWALQTASSILCTIAISWGLGRHASDISSPEIYTGAIKYEMLAITTATLCAMFARISFAIFIFYFASRILRIYQYLIGVWIVVQVVFNIIPIAITWSYCSPIVSHTQNYTNSELCWISPHVSGWLYTQGAINATSDICLTLLALSIVLAFNCCAWDKISLGILLSFSLLAMVAAIVKTVEVKLSQKSGQDFIYQLHIWNYWHSIENAVLIITTSIPKIKSLALVLYKSSKGSRILHMWKSESRGPSDEHNFGYRSLHSRNCSGSTRDHSISVPSITGAAGEIEPMPRREGLKISICSPPKRPDRPRLHHRNFSDSISMRSLPNPLYKEHCSTRTLNPSASCNDFTSSTPKLSYRTVISGGDPSAVPPPFPLSLPASGRTSRNSRRGDVSPQDSSFLPVNVGTTESPVMATGPFCILKTNDFTIEYEDAISDTTHTNSKDVDLGWAVMRNEENGLSRNAYNENDADELPLNDLGSILGPSQYQG
ncbi:hypothetical protein BGW36DRAFT_427120 [Talaromyces proteolyticus]|uniref:Rhodopsin domain-containing protein n=1 Tax=Talaromyces proteolyticus TaxID=1131652 RepID=A0AAD4KNX8_9EURO|nr:uncharacterized protein BGW36DRAFT_427120 [Talaromyces proteolyticus]KAH8697148.1 hypothetical protein BGW36DRAFT_427120 [Talaromyces proteolyticus]